MSKIIGVTPEYTCQYRCNLETNEKVRYRLVKDQVWLNC